MEMAKQLLVALALLESGSSDDENEESVLRRLMMESSDDETSLNLFRKFKNNISRKRKRVRYSQCKRKAFMTAVREGKIDKVREIISSRGPCYAEEWKDGYSLLRTALEKKHIEVARLLLTSGSKVNRYKNPFNTPLHFAALNGDIEIIQMLLDRGANIDAENIYGETPLHKAVQSMEMKIIGMLLNHGANVDAADKSGMTPLHLAIRNNSKEITTLLLSRGANVEGKANNARTSRRIATDTGNCSTPLQLAVIRGNEEITELMLSNGADVKSSGSYPIPSLHLATLRGNLKIVQLLLKYGVDVNSASKNGQTPLYFAVGYGRSKIVRLLLECGANVDAKDKNDKTILHFAVEHGNAIIVKRILKHGPDLNDKSNSRVLNTAVQGCGIGYRKIVKNLLEYGFTVNPEDGHNLMQPAVEKGYVELVKELLEHGADVTMFSGSTIGKHSIPLHVATENGHEEVVELLISHGADVNAQNETGQPAIFYATQNADLKIIKLLLTNKANVKDHPELLNIAVEHDCREIVEVLLQHGADVNAVDKSGQMPIDFIVPGRELRYFDFFCTNHNYKGELAKLLLSRGANANAVVENTMSVLHAAVDNGYVKVVEALLEYNADVNSTDEGGMTPLHLSAQRGNKVITEMLLKKGANINAEDHDGMTALHFATQTGHGEVVELLLKRGANVNATTKCDLITPLHLAAESPKRGSDKIVKRLLKFGAKVDSTLNGHAFTPLHKAAITGVVEVVEVLLEFGANVDATDKYGTTALHFASKGGHEEVVTALLEHGADITMKSKGCYTALRFVMDYITLVRDNNYGFDYDFDFDFEYDYDHDETSTYINIAEILKSHMVKMRAANLYAANDDVLSISSGDDEPNDSEDAYHTCSYFDSIQKIYRRDRKGYRLTRSRLQSKCEKEIASMKSEKFVNTYVTFYDILIKNISQLAMYARNESIIGALRSGDYKKKFPIYGSMISINFKKGEKRKELLEQGNKTLDVLFNDFPELPRGCIERILSYLNDDDLRTLIEAGKPYP